MHQDFRVHWDIVDDSTVVITAEGDIDLATAGMFERTLSAALGAAPPQSRIVLDLTGVTFLAASGLTLLASADQRCREQGNDLHIIANTRRVLRPIEIAGMTQLRVSPPAVRHGGRLASMRISSTAMEHD